MSFGGSVSGMISSLKSNNAARKLNRTRHRNKLNKLHNNVHSQNPMDGFESQLSEEEVRLIKNRIRNQMKKAKRKELILICGLTVVSTFNIVIWLFNRFEW